MGVVDAVDGAVFPSRERGGVGGGVGVAGGAVEGEDLVAVAAIHLDFELIEELAVAAPGPVEFHFVARDSGFDHWLEGGEVWRGLATADGSEIGADGGAVTVGFFDLGDEVEDAVDSTAGPGDDSGLASGSAGERRRGKDGEDQSGGAIGKLGLLGGGGAGLLPIPHGREPGAEDVDDPAGVGDSGIAFGDRDAERRGVPGELVAEVFQPHDLFGGTTWVVGLAGHLLWFVRR